MAGPCAGEMFKVFGAEGMKNSQTKKSCGNPRQKRVRHEGLRDQFEL
jgi:hypothetical protein